KAADELRRAGGQIAVTIVGGPGLPQHQAYLENLQILTRRLELDATVRFAGPVPNREVARYYQEADLAVSLSGTGSIDKAVLEPMACGCPVITSNQAFHGVLPDSFVIRGNDFRALRAAIERARALKADERAALGKQLREIVVERHALEKLAEKIISACGRQHPA
ncbi:MAG: glycosyltransferase family 4 protein, partial [Patescibacteria group bacterium]|nr:glycosyltransferase family 4 protein [Patescibacteria group bacterium]